MGREELDERAAIAARLMEEGRGMGLVSRYELQGLLQRCADSHAASQDADGSFNPTREARWEDWDEQAWAPPKLLHSVEEKPPPGLTPKEMKKWFKRQERVAPPEKPAQQDKPLSGMALKQMKKGRKRQ